MNLFFFVGIEKSYNDEFSNTYENIAFFTNSVKLHFWSQNGFGRNRKTSGKSAWFFRSFPPDFVCIKWPGSCTTGVLQAESELLTPKS